MSGKRLLDTSVIVALFRGDDQLRARLAAAAEVYLSATVVGELYYGARLTPEPEKTLKEVTRLADIVPVLACDRDTASQYSLIKVALRRRGTPLPENDIWIAAIAIQHGFSLATRDQHFSAIDGLAIESW